MRPVALLPVFLLALSAGPAVAQRDAIVGSWRGTSLCVDKEHWPACHDEQVIYDARAKGVRDTVTLRADKVVNGEREFMAEFDFILGADGAWVAELQTGRGRIRIVLRIAGTHMTGSLIDVTSGRAVRAMALDRVS